MATSPELAFQTYLGTQIAAALASYSPVPVVTAHPAPNQALPYVHIGESDTEDHPAGQHITVVVHTWSETEGPHQCKEIQQRMREALHPVPGGPAIAGAVSGWQLTCIRETFADVVLDPDERTHHGVQRFRCFASLT